MMELFFIFIFKKIKISYMVLRNFKNRPRATGPCRPGRGRQACFVKKITNRSPNGRGVGLGGGGRPPPPFPPHLSPKIPRKIQKKREELSPKILKKREG